MMETSHAQAYFGRSARVHGQWRASDTPCIGPAYIGEAALCNACVVPEQSSLPCAGCLNFVRDTRHPRLQPTARVINQGRRGRPGRSPAMTETSTSRAVQSANCYCETVCTTLLSARVLVTGTFASLTSASSYSGRVWNAALAFICTSF